MSEPFECQRELLGLFDELVNVMFCIKSTDGTYREVNHAFVRRAGRRSKRDVIGRRASELFASELAQRYEDQDTLVFATGEPLRNELELIRREPGDLGWFLTVKLPVFDHGDVAGLVSVSRDLHTPSERTIAVRSLTRVVDHVREHIAEHIEVAELARVAGCSPSQLGRRMRHVFGLSPSQFVLKSRIDAAARLLAETNRPVAEVAAATGFYDQADLTRRFARLTNETPAQFRSSHRTS